MNSLDSMNLGSLLSPNELALVRRGDLRRVENLYGTLKASPGLADYGVRRDMLLPLVERMLPAGYTDSAPVPITFGASPQVGISWPARIPPGGSTVGPLADVNLLTGVDLASWTVRDQAGKPNCVAEATVACIELMAARAAGGTAKPWSVRFVDQQLRALRHVPAAPGTVPPGLNMAKLSEAAIVLENFGIHPAPSFNESAAPAGSAAPDAAELARAAPHKHPALLYQDFPPPANPAAGLARWIHSELKRDRPVAIAIPGYRDRRLLADTSSWDRGDVWRTGIVPDRTSADDETVDGSGHTVCVVAFQASSSDSIGGYFVFRNSWGNDFGRFENEAPAAQIPHVPMPGYGAISATQVEHYCWEAVSFSP